MRAKPKVYPTTKEPVVQESSCEDRKTLRRSNGVNSFPNVLLFQTFMSTAGNHIINSFSRFKINIKYFFFKCRTRLYSCLGSAGQPKKQEWVGHSSTGKTKKVSCLRQKIHRNDAQGRLPHWSLTKLTLFPDVLGKMPCKRLKCLIILYLKKMAINNKLLKRLFCNFVKKISEIFIWVTFQDSEGVQAVFLCSLALGNCSWLEGKSEHQYKTLRKTCAYVGTVFSM